MVWASGTLRCVTSGTLAGGEIFSFTQAFRGDAGWSDTEFETAYGQWVLSVQNVLCASGILAEWPSTTHFTKVRAYLYGAGGALVKQGESADFDKQGSAPSASPLPNQLALVVTLLTGFPGRSKRGRVYLPAPAASQLSADGQASSVSVDTIGGAYRDALQAMKDDTLSCPPVVASATTTAMTDITSIRVDSKLDTQRRRAASVAADHTATGDIT